MPQSKHGAERAVVAVGAFLWLAAFWVAIATMVLTNDHFGRISPARQIAVYGELPFRDFLDPGYFLTEFSSAAMQRLLGDNLLGEVLMTSFFIATGAVFVFLLARRVSQSTALGVATAAAALLLLPRGYDYDKVLFYPLGLWLCARYADRQTPARLVPMAVCAVAGSLYRYDTGVYLGAASAVSMAVVHAGAWRTFWRRLAVVALLVVALSIPPLAFLQFHGGLANVIDQTVTYGRRETERTRLTSPPRFTLDAAGESRSATATNSVETASSSWTTNANALLYELFRWLPLVTLGSLVVGLWVPGLLARGDAATLAGVSVMAFALNVFILRDPVGARFGGMAAPGAVLAAWLLSRPRRVKRQVIRRTLTGVGFLVAAVLVWSVSASADWRHRIPMEALRPRHVSAILREWAQSPPALEAIVDKRFVQLVRYLRECTGPDDRVLATWFVPELYFYTQRGFGAGIVAMFGDHWSEDRFQSRSVELLSSQRVLLIISRANDESYRHSYPLLARYLSQHYRDAGTSDFGVSDATPGYTVLARRDRTPSYIHQASSMPCYW